MAIQWGSGKAIYAWRLADWVEEVQDISRKNDASFLIILREPKARANRLAREGVSRSSFSFDASLVLVCFVSLACFRAVFFVFLLHFVPLVK